MKLSQRKVSLSHRMVLFGSPKTGKTEMVGRLAEKYKLLWFDLENGWSTLTKLPQEWQERIELVTIPDTRTYPIAIETMLKVIRGTEVFICEDHGKVACPLCKKDNKPLTRVCLNELAGKTDEWVVVVDSLTQLANSAMAHITKNQPDDYKCDWEDFRRQGVLMDKFLSDIQQSQYNIVCITHETETELDDGKKRLVPVAGTTSFSRNTAKYFDHCIRAEVKNKKHVFGSSTDFSVTALTGSRTDVAIEKQKEGEQSLFAFFDSTAPISQPVASPSIDKLAALRARTAGK